MAEGDNPIEPGEGSSPRSTLLVGRMTTVVPNIMKENHNVDPKGKVPKEESPEVEPTESKEETKDSDRTTPTTPLPHDYYGYGQYQTSATPRTQSGGYYYGNHQMTPEPNSPAPPYDMANFGLPGAAFVPAAGSSFLGPNSSPVPRVAGSISPLFPRPEGRNGPPNLPYMASPSLGTYAGAAGRLNSQPSEEGWGGDSRNHANNYHLSPQVQNQQMPMPPYGVFRAQSGDGRAYSFEEMIPPLGLDDQNSAYLPYPQSPASPGQSVFLQQTAWGYAGTPDLYGPPSSPLQPRPSAHLYPAYNGISGGGGMRGPMPYGQYYPASSPGPPIQTTGSNKGPEGANLFIFHIPNHFTNLDMFQLFTPYGNLLSVRIMVEKDTGRSRGFGFVSYDSPNSAAVAIKELNGFPIGNKRLKVQHKQIRRQDMHEEDAHDHYGGDGESFEGPNLPPSGHTANNMWFDTAAPEAEEPAEKQDTSALDNLESLQSALPDIPGKNTTDE